MACCKTCKKTPCALSCARRYAQCEGGRCKTAGCQLLRKNIFKKLKEAVYGRV